MSRCYLTANTPNVAKCITLRQLGELVNTAASLVVVEGDSMLLAQKCAKFVLDEAQKGGALSMLALGALDSARYNMKLGTLSHPFLGALVCLPRCH